jgi:Uri superfamily endonuclease
MSKNHRHKLSRGYYLYNGMAYKGLNMITRFRFNNIDDMKKIC